MTPMGEDFLILDEASYGHRRYPLPRWLIERTMRAAAAVRCISPMVLEYTTDYGHPAAMVPLNVANSTLAARSTPPQDAKVARARLRDELQFTRRGLALSLGRLHPFKGIHVLVQAMVHTPDVDLVIAGPTLRVGEYGDYGQYLAEEARRLGVNDRVHLLGAVPHEDVSALMAAADVVVVPSLLESMNRVCAEAAASGTPFIVTSSTGAADLVQEPGVGQVVAPRDPEAIAAAINDVVSGTWEADVEAAGRFVDQFDASAIAPQLLALIREGIGRR
jgi:glycosyltransferase involved in cell wall biosynthesis